MRAPPTAASLESVSTHPKKGSTTMTTDTLTTTAPVTTDSANRGRLALLGIVLGGTSVLAIPAGLFWPEPAGGGETYAFSDIVGQRDLWWGLLTAVSIGAIISVALQALATMLLVRRRGSTLATVGGALMWFGITVQGVAVAGWATAYFFPTDPTLNGAGRAVFEVVNDDIAHIFVLMLSGAALALIGQVIQAVALLRAKVVPLWVPVLSLSIVPTFVIPGNGVIGLITQVPMAAAAVGIGYYAWRRVS
jgi:hypothetical protein